jgi:hypothetical protein
MGVVTTKGRPAPVLARLTRSNRRIARHFPHFLGWKAKAFFALEPALGARSY